MTKIADNIVTTIGLHCNLHFPYVFFNLQQIFCWILWPADLITDIAYLIDIGIQLKRAYRDDHGIMVSGVLIHDGLLLSFMILHWEMSSGNCSSGSFHELITGVRRILDLSREKGLLKSNRKTKI